MSGKILPIVEGRSEVGGIPVLLRRLLIRLDRPDVSVDKPYRILRDKIVLPEELERAVILATRNRTDLTSILIVLDADDDEPARLENTLLERARRVTRLPIGVVAANRELEAWFLGSKDSLRGICGIRPDANAPPDPEKIRGAKERLSKNMPGRIYVPMTDQPALAARMDLDKAMERCHSFRRLISELERILTESA